MRIVRAALLALAAAGCARAAEPVTTTAGGGLAMALSSEDAFPEGRPVLHLECGAGPPAFALGMAGSEGAGVIEGSLKVDDGVPVRMRLVRGDSADWAPRLSEDRRAALARAIAGGRNIYFAVPNGVADRIYRWNMTRLGGDAVRLRAACA